MADSPHAARKVVLSTVNRRRNGMKVMSMDQTSTTSDDTYAQTYAVNAERYTRNEWIAKYGPGKVRHWMESYLVRESNNPYNEEVPESMFYRVRNAREWQAGRRRHVSESDALSFEELEDLFWECYPEDVLAEA